MRKQDQLVHLIHTMSPAEKKHFREFATRNKTGKSYIKLYEELQKAKTYDADILCKKLGKTKANLAHEKDYLQEVLFKTLRDSHSEVSDIELNNKISNIFILNQRGCHEMALDLTEKAIKECHRTSEFIALIKLYNMLAHIHLYVKSDSKDRLPEQREIMRHSMGALQDMATHNEFHLIMLRSRELWNKSASVIADEDRIEVENILSSDLMAHDISTIPLRRTQMSLKGTLYYLIGQREKALEYKMRELEIIEEYPIETGVDESSYVISVENVFNHMIFANLPKDAEAFINKLQTKYYHKLPLNQAYLDRTFKASHYKYVMRLYAMQYLAGERSKKDIEKILKKFEADKDSIARDELLVGRPGYYVNAYKLAFLIGDYDTSVRWIDMVISHSPEGVPDFHTSSRIALAIMQYEFGNYTVSKSLAASAANYIKKTRPLTQSEKAILRFLSNIWRTTSKKEKLEALQKLHSELAALRKIPMEHAIQQLFYYDEWINRNLK